MPRLPKKYILRGYEAFTGVLTRGEVVACGSVKLFFIRLDSSRLPRVGFSVSRTIRTAVHRNRVKRCLREAYRLNKHLLQQAVKIDLVVIYRGPSARKTGEIDCKRIAADVSDGLKSLMERIQKQ